MKKILEERPGTEKQANSNGSRSRSNPSKVINETTPTHHWKTKEVVKNLSQMKPAARSGVCMYLMIMVSFSSALELSALDGNNGFVVNGIATDDGSGISVRNAGDVNGDGCDDFIVGAHYVGDYVGAGYVVYGGSNVGINGSIDLADLDGSNGFVLRGASTNDWAGYSVSGAGDFNADGYADVIVGAQRASETYLVFGGPNIASSIQLSNLDGSTGYIFKGDSDRSGVSVASAGDINGDGHDDIVIGGYIGDPNGLTNAGVTYVVLGALNFWNSGSFELSALNGTNGFVVNGKSAGDVSGWSVSSAGDFNGDGYSDIVVGAFNAGTGESNVLFGRSTFGSTAGIFELSSLNGSNGFVISGNSGGDAGYHVSGGGDINGDGYDDVIIGAYKANPNGVTLAGESYVVFGGSLVGSSGSFEVSDLDGSNGYVFNGIDADDYSGVSVSNAGDVNGDGYDDILIGACYADPHGASSGESYLVYGGLNIGSSAIIELSDLDGSNGFVLNGTQYNGRSGFSLSNAGDVNGDGYGDIIIGAPWENTAGASYIVFGTQTTPVPTNTPVPTTVPSSKPTDLPAPVPTPIPSASSGPTDLPTPIPTTVPTPIPTLVPSSKPTDLPTPVPTTVPSSKPTDLPTPVPTTVPSSRPTDLPTPFPTSLPTIVPTLCEDSSPYCQSVTNFCATSFCPTCPQAHYCDVTCRFADCSRPTPLPSFLPTPAPSLVPSLRPTTVPSSKPSLLPTRIPSWAPSNVPTSVPHPEPSHAPTHIPSVDPTRIPTMIPTEIPTISCFGTEAAFYTLTLFDSGGNGWNGTRLKVITALNTTLLSTTLSADASSEQKLCLPTGCFYIVVLVTDPEISWNLKAQNNIYRTGIAPSNTEFCTDNGTFYSSPTLSPTTSLDPTIIPTPSPSNSPTPQPTPVPTPDPTSPPTWSPIPIPTETPTINPTGSPTLPPTPSPSNTPASAPTNNCADGEYLLATPLGSSCVQCEPGRYSVVEDAITRYPTSCSWCPIGYYSRAGASSCIACAEGKVSNGDQSDCVQCQSGQFVNVTTQRCFNCTAGKYAPIPLNNQCVDCIAGSVTGIDTGAIVCDSCTPGTYSIGDGVINSCVNCSAGFYSSSRAQKCIGCDAGSFASSPQSSSCRDCDAGKSTQGLDNATECSNCLMGYYSATRASTCVACPIGHYANSESTANCRACAAGTFTNQQKSKNCTLCPAGQYQEATGRMNCEDCGVNRYAAQMSSKYCEECKEGFASLQGSSQCDRCTEKYFWAYTEFDDSWACEPCPYGANCAGGLYQPSPKTGFWIDRMGAVDDPSLMRNVYKCPRDNCVKLATTTDIRRLDTQSLITGCLLLANFSSSQCSPDLFCDEGSHGPLCGACDAGWSHNSRDRTCARCAVTSTLMQAITVIGAGLCGAVLLWSIRNGTIYVPPFLRLLNRGKSKIRIPFLGMLSLVDSGSLKILWATLQIILSVSWNLNISFPNIFLKMTSWLSFIQLDFINLKCLEGSYFLGVYISSAFPVLLALLIWSIYAVRLSFQKCIGHDKSKLKKLTNETIYSSLVVVYLFLPPVAAIQFRALLCIELEDGQRYLRADTDTDCNSHSYRIFTLVNGCMIAVYQALPLIYLYLLYRLREKLNPIHFSGKTDRAFRVRDFDKSLDPFRFLFDDYKLGHYYFEVVDLYRRILFTGILPLIAKDTAIIAYLGATLAIVSAIYFRETVPYRVEFTNIIAVIAQYSILLVFMAALMIETNSLDTFHLSDFTLGVILVVVTSLVFVFTVIGSFRRFRIDGLVNAYEGTTRNVRIEWACGFSANKFQTTFDFVINRNVYDTHVLVYYYTSMVEAKAILKFGGIPALKLDSRLSLDTDHAEFLGDRGGVVVSLKGPQHLSLGDPSLELMNPLASTREVVFCLSLPCELLWKLKPSRDHFHIGRRTGEVTGTLARKHLPSSEELQSSVSVNHLRCFPGEVLDAMLPYEVSIVEAPEKISSMKAIGNLVLFSANILRAYQLKDDVELIDKRLSTSDLNTLSSKISKKKKKFYVVHPINLKQYCDHLNKTRESISALGLLPLYYFVSPAMSSDLATNGIMLPTDQVGVYLSAKGPCCFGLGTDSFMKNLIAHKFGSDQVDKFEGRGFLDLLIVYGAEPACLEKSPEEHHHCMFGADRFEEFSKPNSGNGDYYLRPDRIFAGIHLKGLLQMEMRKEDWVMLNKEIRSDMKTGQLIHQFERETQANALSIMLKQKSHFLVGESVDGPSLDPPPALTETPTIDVEIGTSI